MNGDRISIVGYSVPLTDLTTANMLEHTIGRLDKSNRIRQIDVVDPYPKAALDSLAGIGVPQSQIKHFETVSQWVEDLARATPMGYQSVVPFSA